MKKIIMGVLVCIVTSFMIFSGCDVALENSPKTQSNMKVNGNVLVYDNYIYFANAYKSYSSLTGNDNNTGNVKTESMKRIALENGNISTDEETKLPKNIETVVSKVVGYENSFMCSVGDNIIFASPNTHKDRSSADKFEYNTYFSIKTNGTGLNEFYTTNTKVSQQAVYEINEKSYLFIVDVTLNEDGTKTNKLVRIEIGNKIGKAVIVAEKFDSIVFAENYTCVNDMYAYFTKAKENNNESLSEKTILTQVNMLTGQQIEIASVDTSNSLTLKLAKYGKLYFTMKDATSTFYYEYTPSANKSNFATKEQISFAIDKVTINNFDVTINQNQTTYFIFQDESKTYAVEHGDKNFANSTLINSSVTILFNDVDYIYYSSSEGIYRISVLDKEEQTISTQANFKNEKIAFDGEYIYFYAQSVNNSTDTYYMYRAATSCAELGNQNVELISELQEEDQPETTEE